MNVLVDKRMNDERIFQKYYVYDINYFIMKVKSRYLEEYKHIC